MHAFDRGGGDDGRWEISFGDATTAEKVMAVVLAMVHRLQSRERVEGGNGGRHGGVRTGHAGLVTPSSVQAQKREWEDRMEECAAWEKHQEYAEAMRC